MLPPHFRCQSQVVGPQVTLNFCPTWLHIRGSHDPLFMFGSINLLERLTELRQTLTYIYNLLKDMIKDTDEQKMRRYIERGLRGSRVQKLLSLWSWDESPSWYRCVRTSVSPLNRVPLAYYGGFLNVGMIDYELHFQPLSPLWRMGWGWKS